MRMKRSRLLFIAVETHILGSLITLLISEERKITEPGSRRGPLKVGFL